MKIEILTDDDGEWCQMWINGKLFREDHHEREFWWHELMEIYFPNVEIIEENKCLDDGHTFCNCEEK